MTKLSKPTIDAITLSVNAMLAPLATKSEIDTSLAAFFRELNGKGNSSTSSSLEERRLVSFVGAARLLAVSRSTIYELVRQKRLDALELSGTRKITMRSINAFLNGERPANEKTAEAIRKNAAKYATAKVEKEITK